MIHQQTRTFQMPRTEQFAKATYLEAAFKHYAADIGCNVIHTGQAPGEIETYSEKQAMLLRNWWMEHGL